MLAYHRIDLVMDVGANTGQFAMALRGAGYRGRIVSFEPLASAHRELLVSSRHDPGWEIATRQAIGSEEGKVELHIAGNSVSSSMLSMLPSHSDAAPDSTYVGTEVVELTTLDRVAPLHIGTALRPFLKIDTQGTEDRVLDGAVQQLLRTQGVQLELSLLPLYEGQQLFDQLDARLQALGFRRWAIEPVFSDDHTGRMLQVDGTYFRD
jgi:FkbM family methyltransferase